MSGTMLDMQGVLSAITDKTREQNERHWQFQLMKVDAPGDRGERKLCFCRHTYQPTQWKIGERDRMRKRSYQNEETYRKQYTKSVWG